MPASSRPGTNQVAWGGIEPDGDVDGVDLAQLAADPDLLSLSVLAEMFGRANCPLAAK